MILFPYGSAAPKVFRARYFCLWFAEGLVAPHQSPICLGPPAFAAYKLRRVKFTDET